LEYAIAAGAETALVTSTKSDVSIFDRIDHVIRTSRPENSSAYTISHICALTVLLRLATLVGTQHQGDPAVLLQKILWSPQREFNNGLSCFVADTISANDNKAKEWAQLVCQKKFSTLYFLGFGENTVNAFEAALKVKEAAYLNCQSFHVEQFLHGPMVALNSSDACIFMVPKIANDQVQQRVQQIISATKIIGAHVTVLSSRSNDLVNSITTHV